MKKILKTFLLAAIVGILSGLQGMAGAIYILFGLIYLNIVDSQQEAAGTTLVYTSVPLTLGAAYIYYEKGKVNIDALKILIPTAFIFSVFGAKLNFHISKKYIYLSMSILLLLISGYFFNKFNKEI